VFRSPRRYHRGGTQKGRADHHGGEGGEAGGKRPGKTRGVGKKSLKRGGETRTQKEESGKPHYLAGKRDRKKPKSEKKKKRGKEGIQFGGHIRPRKEEVLPPTQGREKKNGSLIVGGEASINGQGRGILPISQKNYRRKGSGLHKVLKSILVRESQKSNSEISKPLTGEDQEGASFQENGAGARRRRPNCPGRNVAGKDRDSSTRTGTKHPVGRGAVI